MTFSDAVSMAFAKYATFSGRARRSEYWFFTLFQLIAIVVSYLVMMIVPIVGILLYIVVVFGTFIPHLSVSVRRLHDIDRSGWFILVGLIPFVGWIFLLIWFCTEGTLGANRYGDNPKAVAALTVG